MSLSFIGTDIFEKPNQAETRHNAKNATVNQPLEFLSLLQRNLPANGMRIRIMWCATDLGVLELSVMLHARLHAAAASWPVSHLSGDQD
jgi:hypothetical protein